MKVVFALRKRLKQKKEYILGKHILMVFLFFILNSDS